MFLILPDSLDPGIQSMEANLTTDTIKALMTTLQVMYFKFLVIFSLQDEVVNVKVPRFQIEATRNLDEEIRSLGVEAIFTPGVADFTNMVRRNLINLSQFRHRWSLQTQNFDSRLHISGQRLRRKSGGGTASMLQIRNKKLEF